MTKFFVVTVEILDAFETVSGSVRVYTDEAEARKVYDELCTQDASSHSFEYRNVCLDALNEGEAVRWGRLADLA